MAQTKRSGRGIRRLITLCGSITQLIAESDRCLASNGDGENDDDEDNDSDNDDDDDDNDDEDSDGNRAEKKQEIKRRASY